MEIALQAANQASDSPYLAHSRILVGVALILAIVLSQSLWTLGLLSLFVLYLWSSNAWFSSASHLKGGLKRLLVLDGLIVLTILPLPFASQGAQIELLGAVSLSKIGLMKAAEVFIKSSLSVGVMLCQMSGMRDIELARGLRRLNVPAGFILLLQFTLRYISVMQQELSRLKLALRARGFGGGSTLHKWRSYGYLFGTLFVKALDRSDRIWQAMRCRGYRGEFPLPVQESRAAILSRRGWVVTLCATSLLVLDVAGVFPGFRF